MSNVAMKKNKVPLYLQIAEVLRQRIAKGVWARGDSLPTLNRYCQTKTLETCRAVL